MPAEQLRDRYVSLLLDKFAETRYPSGPMMDRLEAAITSRGDAEAYVERLLDDLERDKYPSPMMVERVNRLIALLERA